MSLLAVNEVLQWTFIVVILFMLVGVLIMLTDIRRRLGPDQGAPIPTSGLANGTLAPNITAEDRRTGQRVSLSDHAGQRVLVAFMSPTCMPCKELLPNLNRFAGDRRDVSVVVVATDGAGVDYARQFSEQIAVVGDADKEIQKAFDVGWTPLVYLLDEERRVVNRTISNSLVDLEDTLDGKGRPQGAAWVPTESTTRMASPNGGAEHGADGPG